MMIVLLDSILHSLIILSVSQSILIRLINENLFIQRNRISNPIISFNDVL